MYWSNVLWPYRCFVVSLVFIVKRFVHVQTIEKTFLTSLRFYLQTNFVTNIGNKAFKRDSFINTKLTGLGPISCTVEHFLQIQYWH